jgi:hypothetical protein
MFVLNDRDLTADSSQTIKRLDIRKRRSSYSIPAHYRNRPTLIRTAIYRTWEYSIKLGFTKSTTAVLQAILATGVSASNPFEPVFAKKEKLAKLAKCSETSVYRALNVLQDSGWIIRQPQKRLDDGSLDIGLIVITKKLAELLELIKTKNELSTINTVINNNEYESSTVDYLTQKKINRENHTEQRKENTIPSKTTSQIDNSSSFSYKMKDGLKDGYIYEELTDVDQKTSVNNQSLPAFIKLEGRSVARELVWLITEGKLTFGGLFKLQTLAKKIPGQLLSHFVAYKSERIKELKTTNDCYRYLKKLILEGIDARYLCAQRKQKEKHRIKKLQSKEAAERRQAWYRAHDGLTYKRPGDTITYKVNGQHGLLEVGKNGLPINTKCLKIESGFIQAVEKGTLLRFTPETADRDSIRIHLSNLTTMFPSISKRFRKSTDNFNKSL